MKKIHLHYLVLPVLSGLLAACAPSTQTSQPTTSGTNQASTASTSGNGAQSGQAQGLQSQSSPQMIPLNSPKSPISSRTVYFKFNSSQVGSKYLSLIKHNAAYLISHPDLHVKIEGNCDDRGTQAYNMALGQRRAQAVANLMVLQGVSSSQMQLISYGKDNPVCLQQTDKCWSLNRRVNIVYPANKRQ